MSAITGPGAQRPPDDRAIAAALGAMRGELVDFAEGLDAYIDAYTWKKTDLAGSAGGATAASHTVLPGNVRSLGGWAITETSGVNVASVRLHDGANANAEQFGRINLQANESVRDLFDRHGVRCSTGRIFLEVIAGSVEGVIYWR